MNTLTIEYDTDFGTRVSLDGERIGIVQRLAYTDHVNGERRIEIDQIVYTKEGAELAARLRAVPGLTYTPTFMALDGRVVAEEDWVAPCGADGA